LNLKVVTGNFLQSCVLTVIRVASYVQASDWNHSRTVTSHTYFTESEFGPSVS